MKARARATIATPCAVALLSAGSANTAADGGDIDGTDGCTAYVIVTEHSAKTGKTTLDPCDSHAVRGKFQGNSGLAQWSKWVKSGATLLVLALSGCSGDGEPAPGASPSVDWSGYSQLVTEVVEEAKAGGASAEQIAALEQIAAAGEITYADLERMQATFVCFEASGIPYSYEPPAEGIDYPEGMYFHGDAEGISEDQSLAIADDCIYRESFYVDTAYQFSPAVTARRDREDQAHLPAAIECVKELGIDPGDADTMSELSAVVDESGNNAATDCLVPPEQVVAWD